MANHVTNDRGQVVIAEGAPASEARVAVEYPALLHRINAIYSQCYAEPGRRVDLAIEEIRAAGITSRLETRSLLAVSDYGREQAGSVTGMVMQIGEQA